MLKYRLLVNRWNQIQTSGVLENYTGVRATPPKKEPWGATVVYIWGPAGELWHISQNGS